jgi:ABC-type lipoprotein release transport system permease subunit
MGGLRTYAKLAWRNLFRNKRRTFIAGSAIGIGLAALIFTDALMKGMEINMVRSATSSFLGEGQIHRSGYRETSEVELTIDGLEEIIPRLESEKIVEHFTERVISFGMITSPANVSSVGLIGVHPQTEQYLSQIDEAIVEGVYFGGDNERDILIGSKLAEILEVELRDRVVITSAQAHTGDLSQEMFRVSGIYHFNVPDMDRGMALVRLGVAQRLLGLGEEVHEIALTFTESGIARDRELPFWEEYTSDSDEAVSWTTLLPQMEAVFELSQFSMFFLAVILFGVVTLGIINTLFMSLHERMFEFGVLRAVGTRPAAMALLILFEAASLAVVSTILGTIFGFIITYIFTQTGIDYTGIEFVGVTFRELLYPVMRIEQFIKYPFWVFVFTVVVGLYPAIYAARMLPADAMRKSM